MIDSIGAQELKRRRLETLSFDEVLLDLVLHARLVKSFQIVNGQKPDLIERGGHKRRARGKHHTIGKLR